VVALWFVTFSHVMFSQLGNTVCSVACLLCVQVVFEAAAPVGNTDALSTKQEQLFPHLVSFLQILETAP
jgi:hypothetical protein